VAALGFFTLNPPSCKASHSPVHCPVTYNALFGSTTTRMPPDSTRIYRDSPRVLQIHLVLQPEQPPPTTATRNTPWARPCLVSSN